MMFILSIICCIAGGYYFYCNAMGAIGQVGLLSTDTGICPADFRPMQAHGRRILVTNSLVRLVGGSVILIAGALSLVGSFEPGESPAQIPVLATGLVLCTWTLLSILLAKGLEMNEKICEISEQWHKEKRISSRHDDEVRLYRVLKEAVEIPAGNFTMLLFMFTAFVIS